MNVFVTWAPDPIPSPTDSYNILYKIADPLNLNSWTLANPTPLPSTATSYTIVGLTDNTVYRIAVEKICDEIPTNLVSELTYYIVGCPEISYYQGPPVNGYPTLFYSVAYPNSTNVEYVNLAIYDITALDYSYLAGCGVPAACSTHKYPIGRGVFFDAYCPPCFGSGGRFICGEEYAPFLINEPSDKVSSTGYYGLRPKASDPQSLNIFCPPVAGTLGNPILLNYNSDYRFNAATTVDISPDPPYIGNQANEITAVSDATCTTNAVGSPSFTPVVIAKDNALLSGVFNYNTTTGKVVQNLIDGSNQTALNTYSFSYTTEDSSANTFPLYLMNPPLPSTALAGGPNITYYRYAPVPFPITAPELSNGMTLIVQTLNPVPGNLINTTNLNVNGFTPAQLAQQIVNFITPLGYPSARVVDSGNLYILFGLPDPIFTGAQITIDGPSVIGGPQVYTSDVHNILNTNADSNPVIVGEDINAPTLYGSTIGQYKKYGDITWLPLVGGSILTFLPNDVVEFVMFSMTSQLYQVVNVTTATTYDLTNYSDLTTYPTFNTLNTVNSFTLKCDNVDINPGDNLDFYFINPTTGALPFINSVTISF